MAEVYHSKNCTKMHEIWKSCQGADRETDRQKIQRHKNQKITSFAEETNGHTLHLTGLLNNSYQQSTCTLYIMMNWLWVQQSLHCADKQDENIEI